MDAKDRLRRYLEQRREMGESELILDGLPVDEVLRMLGAPAPAVSDKSPTKSRVTPEQQSRAEIVAEPSPHSELPDTGLPPAEPPSPAVQNEPPTNSSDAAEMDVAAPTAPADPAARFDSNAPTDWRTALRNANVPDVSEVRTVTPPTEDAGTQYPTSQVELPAAPPTADNGGPAAPLTTDAATQSVKSLGELPAWLSALNIPAGMSFSASANFIFPAVLPTDAVKQLDTLDGIAGMIAACRACALGYTALNPVPGEGNPNADVVCVGEAPGQTEDETGRPFVGASGQLLTKILGAIQLQREDVFICNVVKHRPPGNRNPLPDEVRACAPYLRRQLELVKPKVIIALGTSAAQALLNTSIPMGKLRGQLHRYEGIPVIVTYHPSALLRNENWKRPAWDDVRLARRILDAARAALPPTH